MAKYRNKPVIIEAVQWLNHGDHAQVIQYIKSGSSTCRCRDCDLTPDAHGWIHTLYGGSIVCHGDYIVEEGGEIYPCKPYIFKATYEKVEENIVITNAPTGSLPVHVMGIFKPLEGAFGQSLLESGELNNELRGKK